MVALVLWSTIGGEQERIRALTTVPLPGAVRYLLDKSLTMLTNVSVILIIVAVIDYAWSRYTTEEKMKMTRQELKDESKEAEGNPHLKGAMRRRARDRQQEDEVRRAHRRRHRQQPNPHLRGPALSAGRGRSTHRGRQGR